MPKLASVLGPTTSLICANNRTTPPRPSRVGSISHSRSLARRIFAPPLLPVPSSPPPHLMSASPSQHLRQTRGVIPHPWVPSVLSPSCSLLLPRRTAAEPSRQRHCNASSDRGRAMRNPLVGPLRHAQRELDLARSGKPRTAGMSCAGAFPVAVATMRVRNAAHVVVVVSPL